jgi:hypothetical protein
METVVLFSAICASLYICVSMIRNQFTKENRKNPADIGVEAFVIFSVVMGTNFLLNSFGYASIVNVQSGGSVKAFISKPDF